MDIITYSFATDKDIPAIKTLLQENKLPYEDIDEPVKSFIVAKEQGIIIGTVGLELVKPYALLRSLAVHQDYRNNSIAKNLLIRIIEYAQSVGIMELFLLTATAENYFTKKNFLVLNRDQLPEQIKSTQEFLTLCPDTAICMNKKIKTLL
jgi:amino-acid N-acetyltransferase